MTTVLFTPYGNFHRESKVVSLIAAYLAEEKVDLLQLVCDGALSTCQRDSQSGWRRDITQCFSCIAEQRRQVAGDTSDGNGPHVHTLSRFLTAEIESDIQKFTLSILRDDLMATSYQGLNLYHLCFTPFKEQFGQDKPNFLNRRHESALRQLFHSTIRTYRSTERLLAAFEIRAAFISGGNDYITGTFLRVMERNEVPTIVFRFIDSSNRLSIYNSLRAEHIIVDFEFDCDRTLLLRRELWSPELLSAVEDIVLALGFPKSGNYESSHNYVKSSVSQTLPKIQNS